jgi:hypothetical protein
MIYFWIIIHIKFFNEKQEAFKELSKLSSQANLAQESLQKLLITHVEYY